MESIQKLKEKNIIIYSKLFNKEISTIEQELIGSIITEINLVKITKRIFILTGMKDAKFVILDEIEYCEDSKKLEQYYKFAITFDSKNYMNDILSDVVNRTYSDGIVDESLNEKYVNEFDFLVQKYLSAIESWDNIKSK